MSEQTPGAPSQPEDTTGDGPVTLSDRTEPGGQGSPDTNQGKAEPMAPTTEHPEPLAVPSLDQMNVGGADPQAPRHPGALGSGTSATGAYAHTRAGEEPTAMAGGRNGDLSAPEVDTTTSTGRATGPEQPEQDSTGTAHRAPGLQGETAEGETIGVDVHAGASRLGPQALDSRDAVSPGQGDDHSVPSSGTSATPGTSQEHRIVSGVRLPEATEQ